MGRGETSNSLPQDRYKEENASSPNLLQKPPLTDRPQRDRESPFPHVPPCWTFECEKALAEGHLPGPWSFSTGTGQITASDAAARRCEQPSASPSPRQLLGPVRLQLFETTPG